MRKLALVPLLVVALGMPIAPASAAPPAACPGENGTPSAVFTGTFGTDMEGAYVLVPDVPAGTPRAFE